MHSEPPPPSSSSNSTMSIISIFFALSLYLCSESPCTIECSSNDACYNSTIICDTDQCDILCQEFTITAEWVSSIFDSKAMTYNVMQYKYRCGCVPEISFMDLKQVIVEKNMETKTIVSNEFEVINERLGKYYESQGNSTYYSDPTPNGKFLAYCEENAFEIEDINDELTCDAIDCIYCDFDENFPFFETIKQCNEYKKISEIFRVIKHCYRYNTTPFPPRLCAFNLELNCDKNDMKIATAKYESECYKIWKPQDSVNELFAIGLKNDFPFITYLADSYQRDRMLCNNKRLGVAEWAEKSPFVTQHIAETIQSGLKIWTIYSVPRFHWGIFAQLQCDMKYMTQYFIGAGQFVETLLAKGRITPFACDIVFIATKQPFKKPIMIMPELSDSSSDEEKDNIDSNSSDPCLLRINERLEANHCSYIRSSLPYDHNSNNVCKCLISLFNELFNSNKVNQYPRKKRFCTVIDGQYDDVNRHSLFMFEPPNDCNTFPIQYVTEWYFNASKTCIVPSKDYNNGDYDETLRCDGKYKQQTVTLSFHVESLDCVRCYFWWNGCSVRIIEPNDLNIVLRSISDIEYKHNKQYLNENIIQDVAKLTVINDDVFDTFYKDVSILPM